MNILYFGSIDGTACALHYFTAMVREGHTVIPFDPKYFTPSNIVERVGNRIRKAPSPAKCEQVGQQLIDLCKSNHFDLIFVMAENFLHRQTLETIRRENTRYPIFAYHSHDNNFSDGILKPKDFFETLASYDFAFTTKSQNVKKYQALGQRRAHFIPSAYEPSVHRPILRNESRFGDRYFDVGFVGTYDLSRDKFVEAIGWESLNVWGSHWKKYVHYNEHRDHITPSPIYYLEFADVISHTKISLGLLREEAEDKHTQRTFEIPACKSFQLVPRDEEILSFFEENKEIVCFDSLEELKEKTQYYLKNDKERSQITEAGYRRCLNDKHTYSDRVKEMLRWVQTHQDRRTVEIAS